ncbi:hypothetical protein BJX96DRAFT_165164 [Aspergillus floccosus]
METRPNQAHYKAVENGQHKKKKKKSLILTPLRYRSKSLYLLVFYIAILIIPWILTCIMMVHPVNAPSYVHQGFGMSPSVMLNILGVWDVIVIFRSVQTVLAIPIISGFIAQAAVVYGQRRSPTQKLTLRQVVALADRPWANVVLWFRCWSGKIGSRLAFWGGLFILMVAATAVVQNLLVKNEFLSVATCVNTPIYGCDPMNIDAVIGLDPEPAAMDKLAQNTAVQHVAKKTQMVTPQDFQPYIWADNWTSISDANDINRAMFFWYHETMQDETYFVSALRNGTNTGVLRQHAIRLNSSSGCVPVPPSEYPAECPGDRPFVTRLSASDYLDIRVCAPRKYGQSPWSLSRDRQDITEQLWIDVASYNQLGEMLVLPFNFTMKCTTNTTRGYFEVNNYLNGNRPGPLVEKWPSQGDLARNFNDFLGVEDDFAIPSTVDNVTDPGLHIVGPPPVDPFNTADYYAAGPLMTSAIALFGNQSFFALASNATKATASPCYNLDWKLNSYEPVGIYTDLMDMMYLWIIAFNDTRTAGQALDMATYFANEAVLTTAASQGTAGTSRSINFSDGVAIPKPKWSLAAVITMSILIALQIIGLCLIMAYAQSVPTWTENFDAFAMLRMGAELQRRHHAGLAGIRDTVKEDLNALCQYDGVVGVVEGKEEDENVQERSSLVGASSEEDHPQSHSSEPSSDPPQEKNKSNEELEPPFQLAVGGSGIITTSLAPRKAWRWKKKSKKHIEDDEV